MLIHTVLNTDALLFWTVDLRAMSRMSCLQKISLNLSLSPTHQNYNILMTGLQVHQLTPSLNLGVKGSLSKSKYEVEIIIIPLSRCNFIMTAKLPILSTNQSRTIHTSKGHIFPLTLIQREEGKLSSCSQLVSNKQNL